MPGSNDNMTGAGASMDPLRGFDTDAPPNASLSLLVQMPDGKKRQVEVPPNASVRQLRSSIANIGDFGLGGNDGALGDQAPEDWDLRFGDSSLQDEHTLDHYNIPDVVDHANAVLKAIRDSDYPTEDKKLEALEGAYNVVAGVSRGERDMTRLINAALNEGTDNFVLDPSNTQPSIRAMRRRSRPSRIPSLNFSQLPPLPTSSSKLGIKDPSGVPSIPSTPRDLLLRLSNSRPDLYKFSENDNKASDSISISPGVSNRPTITSAPPPGAIGSPVLNKDNNHADDADQNPTPHGNDTAADENNQSHGDTDGKNTANNQAAHNEGSDMLKRGNTWIDYIKTIGDNIGNDDSIGNEDKLDENPSVGGNGSSEGEAGKSDMEGDSEDEHLADTASSVIEATASHEKLQQKAEPEIDYSKNENAQTNNQNASTATDDVGNTNETLENGESANKSEHSKTSENPSEDNQMKPGDKQVIGLNPTVPGAPETKIPKKRGRKRKNPHLTEEQRKQQRQAQNRESAKLSRLRRKNMTIRYERRVNILEVENTNLRDTVSALQKRLEMLQNLLTITVRPSAGHLANASRTAAATAPVGMLSTVGAQNPLETSNVAAPTALATHPGLTPQSAVGLQPSMATGQLVMPHPQLSTQSRLGPQPQLGAATPFGGSAQRSAQPGIGLPHSAGLGGPTPVSSAAPSVNQSGLPNGSSVTGSSTGRQNPLANLDYRNY